MKLPSKHSSVSAFSTVRQRQTRNDWEISNALEAENNEMLQSFFHDYRKEVESVVFLEVELLHKRIRKEKVFVDLTAATNITENLIPYETVWRFVNAISWLKSLMFSHNIVREFKCKCNHTFYNFKLACFHLKCYLGYLFLKIGRK